jgi:hypothetical protein
MRTAKLLAEEKCNVIVTSPGRDTNIITQYSALMASVDVLS